jgi:flavodoxin
LLAVPSTIHGKIRLFYGSSTGNTAEVACLIRAELGDLVESVGNIASACPRDLNEAEALILGVSTWEDGQLQQDWSSTRKTSHTRRTSG